MKTLPLIHTYIALGLGEWELMHLSMIGGAGGQGVWVWETKHVVRNIKISYLGQM
jgi:hypothetical protein